MSENDETIIQYQEQKDRVEFIVVIRELFWDQANSLQQSKALTF